MAKTDLPNVVTAVFKQLAPLTAEDRRKVVHSVMALFDESMPALNNNGSGGAGGQHGSSGFDNNELGLKVAATRWMKQHQVTVEAVQEVYHIEPGNVQIIATRVPGDSAAEQTKNCYLLTGIRALLATDEPTFQDADAVDLCQNMKCYNSPNHSKHRDKVALTGDKKSGFKLAMPSLRAAAELIKQMAPAQ